MSNSDTQLQELQGVTDELSEEVKRHLPSSGDKVGVHFNLNTGHVTVRSLGDKCYGLVLTHTPGPVVIEDVEFRVRDGVFDNIQDSGQRDVCAYAKGKWSDKDISSGVLVRYNPFERKNFYRPHTGESVWTADYLRVWSENAEDGHKGRMIARL
jgi:hypothetical protein